jgi:hypothetical protein
MSPHDRSSLKGCYLESDPAADMNGDDFVEGNDEDDYLEAFREGCPVPSRPRVEQAVLQRRATLRA